MLINPFFPFNILKVASLKATVLVLFILLLKTNLLRLKGGLIGGLVALILISGIILSATLAIGSLAYAYRLKRVTNENNLEADDQLKPVNI
tara:strand:+ start:1162 stop:1434 length:273 start_codon:yes stop_codon:yes gene_type:complete